MLQRIVFKFQSIGKQTFDFAIFRANFGTVHLVFQTIFKASLCRIIGKVDHVLLPIETV